MADLGPRPTGPRGAGVRESGQQTGRKPNARGVQVLLIQGDATFAAAIAAGLERQGYDVDVAGSAVAGHPLASMQQYDLIVLDGVLPDGDGVSLCRELRRQKVATPILMVSALDATNDKIVGLDAGADDYLTKPFATEELTARLRSLLRRSRPIEPVVLRAGDLVMNLDEHRVTAGGVGLKLSAKEFALLEYMLRNPRKLLTRSMIGEAVWDMNYEPGSNVIDVYVSSLRRRLDRGASRPRIETVTGSGYRFVPPADDDEAPSSPTAT